MTTIQELKAHLIEVIKEYPKLKHEIVMLYNLCLNEIEEGGSPRHEIELCFNDVEELIMHYGERED
jgi:hypothetical protein